MVLLITVILYWFFLREQSLSNAGKTQFIFWIKTVADCTQLWKKRCKRSSRPEVFCKRGVLRNFTKFTGKHLSRVSFLIKLQV